LAALVCARLHHGPPVVTLSTVLFGECLGLGDLVVRCPAYRTPVVAQRNEGCDPMQHLGRGARARGGEWPGPWRMPSDIGKGYAGRRVISQISVLAIGRCLLGRPSQRHRPLGLGADPLALCRRISLAAACGKFTMTRRAGSPAAFLVFVLVDAIAAVSLVPMHSVGS